MIKVVALQCYDVKLAAVIMASIGIDNLVTYTTRKATIDEVDGLDYHFVSKAEFAKLNMEGYFAEISTLEGEMYGLPISIENVEGSIFLLVTPESGEYLRKIYGEECLLIGATFTWTYTLDRIKNKYLPYNNIGKHKKIYSERLENLNTCDIVLNVSDINSKQISYIVDNVAKLLS